MQKYGSVFYYDLCPGTGKGMNFTMDEQSSTMIAQNEVHSDIRMDEVETRTGEQILLDQFAAVLPKLAADELAESFQEMCEYYPEVDLAALATDPLFVAYADNRSGDLLDIYEEYVAFEALAEDSIGQKIRNRDGRATGSGDARTSAAPGGLSEEQKSFLTQWNREHPEYAMTAREYAEAQ